MALGSVISVDNRVIRGFLLPVGAALLHMHAIKIIQDEHHSLAAVLHGLLHIVNDIRCRHAKPDFELLGAMTYYIDAFPERFHHPKEDAYLFPMVLAREPSAAALLDRLREDHKVGTQRIRELANALSRYQRGGAAEFTVFLDAVEWYADFQWKHMLCEDSDVLPLAMRCLSDADWQEIDGAFLTNRDPLHGATTADGYTELFRRIVNLTPPASGGVGLTSRDEASGRTPKEVSQRARPSAK